MKLRHVLTVFAKSMYQNGESKIPPFLLSVLSFPIVLASQFVKRSELPP
jgi:hypothetical protein